MLFHSANTIRRLLAVLAVTAGLSQGAAQHDPVSGAAQFPHYAALTAETSAFQNDAYIGDNAVILLESHSSADGVLSSAYILVDIYLPDVHHLKTYYSDDPDKGLGSPSYFSTMCRHVNAALAVNGDFYDMLSGKNVVRDGVLVAKFVNTYDLCALYEDGSMRTVRCKDIHNEAELTEILKGAWQVWSFGPVLLDDDGRAIEDFSGLATEYLCTRHPRTCIGYYGPGHYCLLTVAGYRNSMPGVTLEELSSFFAELGCRQAFNLDGGDSTHIWFHGSEIGWPSAKNELSDLIYIEDTSP